MPKHIFETDEDTWKMVKILAIKHGFTYIKAVDYILKEYFKKESKYAEVLKSA